MAKLITGKAYWAKVIGKPRPNKFKEDALQWSFDLSVDDDTINSLIADGMRPSYVKDKEDERGKFISFVRDAKKADGTDNKPFRIVDAHNNQWPNDVLIGNGSTLNVSMMLSERTFRGAKFLKPVAMSMQVWDLVDYVRPSEFPSKEVGVAVQEDGQSAQTDW